LREAADRLTGCHDFAAFAANRGKPDENTVRTIHRIAIRDTGGVLTLRFEGDGFLYKMCRGIVGTLVQVGQGKIPPLEIKNILTRRDRREAGMTAPAQGLVLWKVFYPKPSRRRPAPAGIIQ
jgi:tRNA pseudouridine38-40 synthase